MVELVTFFVFHIQYTSVYFNQTGKSVELAVDLSLYAILFLFLFLFLAQYNFFYLLLFDFHQLWLYAGNPEVSCSEQDVALIE